MPFKVIQGHRFWYQTKAHIRLPTKHRNVMERRMDRQTEMVCLL